MNDLLIDIAQFARTAGHEVVAALAWLWSAVDGLLNPLLSPLLAWINPLCNAIAGAIYAVLSPLPPWLGLTILSAALGVAMLPLFRRLSNQTAIGRAKDDIKANLLALKLFKDELRVMFGAQLRILWAIIRLQRHVLGPVLILMPPMLLVLAQMGLRYQWRPLRPGERTNVTVAMKQGFEKECQNMTLEASDGVTIEAGPVPGDGAAVARIRVNTAGRHAVTARVGDRTDAKEVTAAEGFERVSPIRPGVEWTSRLLYPAETPLDAASPIASITVDMPPRDSYITGSNWWIAYVFVVSMIAALVFAPVFRVRF